MTLIVIFRHEILIFHIRHTSEIWCRFGVFIVCSSHPTLIVRVHHPSTIIVSNTEPLDSGGDKLPTGEARVLRLPRIAVRRRRLRGICSSSKVRCYTDAFVISTSWHQ